MGQGENLNALKSPSRALGENQNKQVSRLETELSRLYSHLQTAHAERDQAWSLVPHDIQIEQVRKSICSYWEHLGDSSIKVVVTCSFRGKYTAAEGVINSPSKTALNRQIGDMVEGLKVGVVAAQVRFFGLGVDASAPKDCA